MKQKPSDLTDQDRFQLRLFAMFLSVICGAIFGFILGLLMLAVFYVSALGRFTLAGASIAAVIGFIYEDFGENLLSGLLHFFHGFFVSLTDFEDYEETERVSTWHRLAFIAGLIVCVLWYFLR